MLREGKKRGKGGEKGGKKKGKRKRKKRGGGRREGDGSKVFSFIANSMELSTVAERELKGQLAAR
jgi:hypothetical protein